MSPVITIIKSSNDKFRSFTLLDIVADMYKKDIEIITPTEKINGTRLL